MNMYKPGSSLLYILVKCHRPGTSSSVIPCLTDMLVLLSPPIDQNHSQCAPQPWKLYQSQRDLAEHIDSLYWDHVDMAIKVLWLVTTRQIYVVITTDVPSRPNFPGWQNKMTPISKSKNVFCYTWWLFQQRCSGILLCSCSVSVCVFKVEFSLHKLCFDFLSVASCFERVICMVFCQ